MSAAVRAEYAAYRAGLVAAPSGITSAAVGPLGRWTAPTMSTTIRRIATATIARAPPAISTTTPGAPMTNAATIPMPRRSRCRDDPDAETDDERLRELARQVLVTASHQGVASSVCLAGPNGPDRPALAAALETGAAGGVYRLRVSSTMANDCIT